MDFRLQKISFVPTSFLNFGTTPGSTNLGEPLSERLKIVRIKQTISLRVWGVIKNPNVPILSKKSENWIFKGQKQEFSHWFFDFYYTRYNKGLLKNKVTSPNLISNFHLFNPPYSITNQYPCKPNLIEGLSKSIFKIEIHG